MRAGGAILTILVALVVGYYVYKGYFAGSGVGPGAPPPQAQIDVVGVKNDLLAIANAQRAYLAEHGTYATIEKLTADGAITFSGTNRRGYNYSAEINDGQSFRITATPSDPTKQGWPVLSIDQDMQITQQ